MDTITTTIKRQWLCEIAAKRKRVEYREIKPYWVGRLSRVKAPFLLRLINGMQSNAPELTSMRHSFGSANVVQRLAARSGCRSGPATLPASAVVGAEPDGIFSRRAATGRDTLSPPSL